MLPVARVGWQASVRRLLAGGQSVQNPPPRCGNRIEGLDLREGKDFQADVYLATVPFDRLLGLLPQELVDREPYFGRIRELQSAPITGVHLWFDRPITPLPHAILIGRTSQWLFNRSALWASAEADAGTSSPNSRCYSSSSD